MAAMAQLRFSSLHSDRLSSSFPSHNNNTIKNIHIRPTYPSHNNTIIIKESSHLSFSGANSAVSGGGGFGLGSSGSGSDSSKTLPTYPVKESLQVCFSGGNSGTISGGYGGSGGGGGGGFGPGSSGSGSESSKGLGILGMFLSGWRSRVAADPQFPFKVLMEELVGVTACVIGDMASRPNFGLNELDFVFSTLVVGSILNFTLMYLLAPTAGGAASGALPGIFAACPGSHMFEPGAFSLLQRCGTFVYKGAVFAAVGFAAGLVGTALSNGLIKLRKKMDPSFETPNKPPPTLLNAVTWALHMGISSNLRYQTLNGAEFMLANALPPAVFKTSVVILRCLNNVLGGMSFVILARLTGSQSVGEKEPKEKFA